MDDFDVLARDFGLGTRGKSNPMKAQSRDTRAVDNSLFSDVFGGQPKYTTSSNSRSTADRSLGKDFDYNSIFKSSAGDEANNFSSSAKSSLPVYDRPVYDEDIFDGLPGLKSKSTTSTMRFEDDMFASDSTSRKAEVTNHGNDFDDLLGNYGRNEKGREENSSNGAKISSSSKGFDDLLAGFGSSNSPSSRRIPESRWGSVPTVGSKEKNVLNDPFGVLESDSTHRTSSGVTSDPLEEIGKFGKSVNVKAAVSAVKGGAFDDLDPLSTLGKSSRKDDNGNDGISELPQSAAAREPLKNSYPAYSENFKENEVPMDRYKESPLFQTKDDLNKVDGTASSSQYHETDSNLDNALKSDTGGSEYDDIWLTVSEIPLFTLPSTAPPPSRQPPPIPGRTSMAESVPFSSSFRRKGAEFSSPSKYSQGSQSPKMPNASENSVFSQFDEHEDFSRGRSDSNFDDHVQDSDAKMHSTAAASAAAMKDAMDKAEAKFRHAKEVREREYAKVSRKKEYDPVEKEENEQEELTENQDRMEREWKQKEEEERKQRNLESERIKKIENEKARHVVDRVTREARERAAAQARLKAERDAVEKVNAEARERAERAAVQRAQAEARERAAAEAKLRAEKAAADAKERVEKEEREKTAKAEAEARRRAERAAVERVTKEARERAAVEAMQRAAAEAQQKAAAAARMNQQKNDDLESFFSAGRASSTPRARTDPTDPFFEQFQGKGAPEVGKRAPSSGGTSSNMRKASSSNNVVDELSFIFGAAPSSGEFQDVEGESEERRRARIERHQRTQERAAKALAEKNKRDLQAQKDQEERHRISEMLDSEIKRWAAGKEGNLRALLSTLQYVLWPECGWQPVSLTDLITGASVKKVYRKATLCIHPDKVQQKGATVQQKYIAEKVFDLLKESWNKFNSEELF